MTLEEVLYSIQSFFMERGMDKEMSLNQFNYYLKISSDELWRIKFGTGKEIGGFEMFRENSDAMSRFVYAPIVVSIAGGVGLLDISYKHFSGAYYLSGTYPNYIKIPIDIVTSEEFYERLGNEVRKPTVDYPIATIYNATAGQSLRTIMVNPTTLTNFYIQYVRKPNTPVFGMKLENGIMVYDSTTSTQLDWDDEYHIDIIKLILKYLGIRDQDLVTFSRVEIKEEN